MSRDFDFPIAVKRIIAQRVNYICSNPKCRCFTAGPNVKDKTDTKIADCAHIYSGANDGPRYNLTIDDKFLKSTTNALWLCKNCHRRIDRNWEKYPTDLLIEWKEETENLVENYIESNTSPIKLLNDIRDYFYKDGKNLPESDFNILLAFFKKDFNPGNIVSENDVNLKYYLLFSKFDKKLTIPNRFKYYDLLSQIFINLNDMEKVKEFLLKSIETEYDDPKRIFNEGFYNNLINKKEESQRICDNLVDYPEHHFFLKLLLVNNRKDLDEFIKEIKKVKYSDINIFLNIANKSRIFGDILATREYTYKAIELEDKIPNLCFLNAENLLHCVIKNPNFDEYHPTISEINDLKLSLKLINDTIRRNKFNDEDLQQVYSNLSFIFFLLNDYDKSLEVIDRISNINMIKQSKFLQTRIYYKQHNNELALKEIEKLLEEDKYNLNFLSLKGFICIDLQKYNEALECFELGLNKAPDGQEKRFILGKAEALHFLKSANESELYLLDVFKEKKDITYLINNMVTNYKKDEIEKIVAFFHKHIHKHINEISSYHQNMLGEYFFNLNQFEMSVEIFNISYSEEMNLNFIEKYIRSLSAIDNRIKALKIAQEIRNNKNCIELIPLETSLLDQIGKTEEAEKLAKVYYSNTNNDYSTLIYSFYLIKNKKLKIASKFLNKISHYTNLSTYNFNIYCNCLLEINEPRRAFDQLYEYLRINEESEDACNLFIAFFLRISHTDEIQKYLSSFEDKIRLNSGVRLINEDNQTSNVIFENETNHLKNEYSINSHWGKILINKEKGYLFHKKDGFIEKEYRILDVCHKSVLKWQILTTTSATKFANPIVTPILVDLNAKSVEEMLGKGAEIIHKDSESQDNIITMYKKKIMPLGMLSSFSKRNLLNTIYHFLFNSEYEFIASSGSIAEIERASSILKQTKNITIDLSGCIMINNFELWDEISSYFENIYVAKSSLDEIDNSILADSPIFGESPGSLGLRGKQISLIPRGNDQKKIWKNHLKQLKKIIMKNCKIIEETAELNLYPYKRKLQGLNLNIRESIGKSFIDTLAISLLFKTTLYSEDYVLRSIIIESGIESFWGQPLFSFFANNKLITNEKYFEIITNLLQINYKFIHINVPLLMKSIQLSNYEVDITVNLYLDCLIKSDINSIINIGGRFLYNALLSIPTLLNPTALVMSFYSKYYEKTKSVGHLSAFIDSIYFATGDIIITNLLKQKLVEWKKIYEIA